MTLTSSAPLRSDSKSILIVDDDALVRWSLCSALQKHYSVFQAADGRSALETLDRTPVDLVLTDLKMDIMDGWDLITEIRRRNCRAKILLFTAYDSPEVDSLACRLRVDGVLHKSINLSMIVDLIRSHVWS